jgi:HSP20 family protein
MLRKYESSPLRLFHNEVDKLFEQSFIGSPSTQWMPEVDIAETENELVLTAEMAGLAPEDVDVTLENNELTIKGQKKMEQSDNSKSYHRVERRYGAFTRSFRLPQTVDTENINAQFENGVLKISLAKKESVKARKIEIQGVTTPQANKLSAKAGS